MEEKKQANALPKGGHPRCAKAGVQGERGRRGANASWRQLHHRENFGWGAEDGDHGAVAQALSGGGRAPFASAARSPKGKGGLPGVAAPAKGTRNSPRFERNSHPLTPAWERRSGQEPTWSAGAKLPTAVKEGVQRRRIKGGELVNEGSYRRNGTPPKKRGPAKKKEG